MATMACRSGATAYLPFSTYLVRYHIGGNQHGNGILTAQADVGHSQLECSRVAPPDRTARGTRHRQESLPLGRRTQAARTAGSARGWGDLSGLQCADFRTHHVPDKSNQAAPIFGGQAATA